MGDFLLWEPLAGTPCAQPGWARWALQWASQATTRRPRQTTAFDESSRRGAGDWPRTVCSKVMNRYRTQFLLSAMAKEQFPEQFASQGVAEIAFLGRSNV